MTRKSNFKARVAFSFALASITFFALSCSRNTNFIVETDSDVVSVDANVGSSAADVQSSAEVPQTVSEEPSDFDLEALYNVSEEIELFNGQDLVGWTDENGAEPKGWIVKDGALCLTDPQNGGDLITANVYDNYIFSFEWRFGLDCNSGVKYKIEQPNGKGWIGLEYQIQDDAHVEDGKIEDRKIASLFDVLPASPSSKADAYPAPAEVAPSGEFRSGKIVVAGNHIEHWIDGEKVLSFNVGSAKWNAAKADSKFKNQKNFGLVVSSPILLQCHGYPVEFRNLKLQKLTGK